MKIKKTVFLMILCALFSGCTIIPTSLSTIEKPEEAQRLLKNKSMIFGRIVSESPGYFFTLNAIHQGNRRIYTITAPPSQKLFSKHKEDNRDGYFFAFLPPGDYKIYGVTFTNMIYDGNIKTDMSFIVPDKSAVYLGTIVLSWETFKNYFIAQKGNVRYLIEDEREEAFNRLWRRFPELKKDELNTAVELIREDGKYPIYDKNIDSNNSKDSMPIANIQHHPLTSESINNHEK